MICVDHHLTLSDVTTRIADKDEYTLGSFFLSEQYYLKPELGDLYIEEEAANSIKIAELCEEYSILRPQELPDFPCPNNQTPTEYIRELTRDGWRKLSHKIDKNLHQKYGDRIKFELDIFQQKGFDSYFLIIQDIIKYCESKGWLTGAGRGSAGGSLVSYFLGIVKVDAIKHNLLFERFLNPGRKDLPDIDFDVPKHHREEVLQYIVDKYGHDNVYQIITYQNLKGRSALTEVLRVHGGLDYLTIKRITAPIPDEASISDDLQEMEEQEEDSSSIIRWALENKAAELREWCWINDEGKLEGPYSRRFEQAIRLEGTKKAQSKHACAVVISKRPFIEYAPLVYDENHDRYVGGFEMKDAESSGLLKCDLLGLSTLDRLMKLKEILYNGF
jgi:DNA polymerase-3 subunit alpha